MRTTFASDNFSAVHPAVMHALQDANTGHQPSYGADKYTAAATKLIQAQFGSDAQVCFVTSGTAANILSFKLLLTRPYEAIISPASGHAYADETGAPQSVLGAQMFAVPTPDGKLTVEQLEREYALREELEPHSALPKVVTIAQSTEYGTMYTAKEVKAIADWCHQKGLYLHMDGCRLPNAAVALGASLRQITRDAGVDVLSFGGAKNGLMNAEAVVIFNAPPSSLPRMQKQITQLCSKMRYVAAQFIPYLTDDLWHKNAAHANKLARQLADGLSALPDVKITQPLQTNQVFLVLPPAAKAALRTAGHQFYDWDTATGEVRLVTSWDNTEEDINGFLHTVQSQAS